MNVKSEMGGAAMLSTVLVNEVITAGPGREVKTRSAGRKQPKKLMLEQGMLMLFS